MEKHRPRRGGDSWRACARVFALCEVDPPKYRRALLELRGFWAALPGPAVMRWLSMRSPEAHLVSAVVFLLDPPIQGSGRSMNFRGPNPTRVRVGGRNVQTTPRKHHYFSSRWEQLCSVYCSQLIPACCWVQRPFPPGLRTTNFCRSTSESSHSGRRRRRLSCLVFERVH
jgi:hypothetical protein